MHKHQDHKVKLLTVDGNDAAWCAASRVYQGGHVAGNSSFDDVSNFMHEHHTG